MNMEYLYSFNPMVVLQHLGPGVRRKCMYVSVEAIADKSLMSIHSVIPLLVICWLCANRLPQCPLALGP